MAWRGLMLVLPLAMSQTACKREPTFEERYEKAREGINRKAKEIDARIAATGSPPAAPVDPGR
jgi:hypothetical protein